MTSFTFSVPYSGNLSKNALRTFRGRPYWSKPVQEARKQMVELVKASGLTWVRDKVWLSIHVEMPTRKADAINVLDAVADAVKEGIGVDDHWFAIERLDWSMNKTDPKVTVTVRQDGDQDMHYCSKCEQFLPATLEHFYAKSDTKIGLSSYCKGCTRSKNKERYSVG